MEQRKRVIASTKIPKAGNVEAGALGDDQPSPITLQDNHELYAAGFFQRKVILLQSIAISTTIRKLKIL